MYKKVSFDCGEFTWQKHSEKLFEFVKAVL